MFHYKIHDNMISFLKLVFLVRLVNRNELNVEYESRVRRDHIAESPFTFKSKFRVAFIQGQRYTYRKLCGK